MSTPASGPYYFASDDLPGPGQFYWGNSDRFGGIRVVENFNLLAAVLGDDPASMASQGQTLVAVEPFSFGAGTVNIQPFAFTDAGSSKKKNLPIGPRLNAFLSDPLDGAVFDLTLPFTDPRVALSDQSALLRPESTAKAWHTAVDLDVSDHTGQGFDVAAPADGIVEGNSGTDTLCLRHTASNGTDFLTIYAHMVPDSKSHLTQATSVLRGEVIGRVQNDGYTHLHFGVAVRGPGRRVNGTGVPPLWYVIDPFGVYDYRRNISSQTNYNYLPDNTLTKPVKGVHKAYVWRTNPPIGSLLLKEDCIRFSPHSLRIEAISNAEFRLISGSISLFTFPSMLEAGNALSVIKKHGFTQVCFIGRPNPSLQYFK